jgi:hypothetical protein
MIGRLSAEVRVADLFPDPLRRPEIQFGPWTTAVLAQALALSTLNQYHFDVLVWDAAKSFIMTITEYNMYVLGLCSHPAM